MENEIIKDVCIDEEVIKFDNFDLKFFKNLLEQNLLLDNSITILFKPDMVVSAAFTSSKSAMKIWTAPILNFIKTDIDPEQLSLNLGDCESTEPFTFKPFNLYVFKGDIFKRYISVFNNDPVKIEIKVNRSNNVASSMNIEGTSFGGSSLSTNFILSSDEMIMNKVENYERAIDSVAPKDGMQEFILAINDVTEVKKLIKELHKSDPENTSFITFQCDPKKRIINVKDKVFDVKFDMVNSIDTDHNITDVATFDILKSDFIVAGNHTFSFYHSPEEFFIILSTVYNKCVISCLISKTTKNADELETNNEAMSNSITGSSLDLEGIDVESYFD